MDEETGIVTKVDGIMAKVVVQKKSACEGCAVEGTCQPTEEGMEIEVLNSVRAKEGQTVKVSMGPHTYLKGSILLYGFPLVCFIAGVIIGKYIGEEYFKKISSDLVAAVCGFASLIMSLLGVKMWSKKTESKTEYRPFIEEIVN
jgi:sigma-E factor negative regulatory protein RseC